MRPRQVVTISRFMARMKAARSRATPPPSGLRLNNPPCQMEPLGCGDRGRCASSLCCVAAGSPRHRRSDRRLDRPGDLRATAKLLSRFKLIWAVQSCSQKYFPSRPTQITSISPPSHPTLRGVSRSSRTRGGMRWTQAALLTRAFCMRTAKSCGPDASTPASSRWKQFRR
jgi:hypothetical protein